MFSFVSSTSLPFLLIITLMMLLISSSSFSFRTTTLFGAAVVVSAQSSSPSSSSTTTCSGSGELFDPYGGECLSSVSDSDLLEPCSVAQSIAKCGCATCALPGCAGCMSSSSTTSGNNNNVKCAEGWGTEYDDFPCASFDAGSIRQLLTNTTTTTVAAPADVVVTPTLTPTEIDILANSGYLLRSTSSVQLNDQKYFKQKTNKDEAIFFFSTSSSDNINIDSNQQQVAVALTWIPPVGLSIICVAVVYYLIKFA